MTSTNSASAQPTEMSTLAWVLLLLLALIWGGSFYFGRVAVIELPAFTVAFFRIAIAALALWFFMVATGRATQIDRGLWPSLLVMGLLNNVIPFSFILTGQKEIGAGLAAIVNAMTPIWTLVIANFMTSDEKFSPRKIFGIIAGFTGVSVMMLHDLLAGLEASALAQAAVLLATVSYGFAAVYGRRFRGRDPVVISTGQLSASTLLMLPLFLIADQPWNLAMPSQGALWSIIGLAVVCTSFAYVLFFRILAIAGATNVSLVTFLVPVSAILLGIFLLGETIKTEEITGMVLIAVGLVVIDGRLVRRFTSLR